MKSNHIGSVPRGMILYDHMHVRGGAERVTLVLAQALKDVGVCFGYRVPEMFTDEAMAAYRWFDLEARSHITLWRRMKLIRAFTGQTKFLSECDWILYSGTSCPVAVRNHPGGRNIYYCHTIPRFVYDLRDYYLGTTPRLLRPILMALTAYVRYRYEQAMGRMDVIIANSENVRGRIKRYLGRDSVVIHPPCDTDGFQWIGQEGYYLSTARLEPHKRVGVVIEAFRRMPDRRLVVTSGGSELPRLRRLAAGAANISFTDWVSEDELRRLVGNAVATIYISIDEDFGMSPVESMAAGKPVIGVAEGGLLETVVDGVTGILIPADPEPSHVIRAVNELVPAHALRMREACEERARLFDRRVFIERMRSILQS